MPHLVAILIEAAVAFAATNIDDLFILMVLYGTGASFRTVVAGQYLGIAALCGVGFALSLAALAVPPVWVGLLGLLPIALGARQLLRKDQDDDGDNDADTTPGATVIQVAALTFANGGDNLAVYGPLFARRSTVDLVTMAGTFAVLVLIWCVAARVLTRAPGVAHVLKRWGHVLAPIVLIGLGLYIIVSAGALTALRVRFS